MWLPGGRALFETGGQRIDGGPVAFGQLAPGQAAQGRSAAAFLILDQEGVGEQFLSLHVIRVDQAEKLEQYDGPVGLALIQERVRRRKQPGNVVFPKILKHAGAPPMSNADQGVAREREMR